MSPSYLSTHFPWMGRVGTSCREHEVLQHPWEKSLPNWGNPKNPWGERFMADGVGGQARAVSLSAWPKPIGLGGNERPVQDTELCWV